MRELREGYQKLTEALAKIDNASSTTTHQGDHTLLVSCSYNLERALKLIHLVGENLERFKMFEG